MAAPGFIACYGPVQYSEHLGARYPRTGECEVGICRALADETGPPPWKSAALVFDHCHAHGWVRGLICGACNNRVILADRGSLETVAKFYGPAGRAVLEAHLAKCPDC